MKWLCLKLGGLSNKGELINGGYSNDIIFYYYKMYNFVQLIHFKKCYLL